MRAVAIWSGLALAAIAGARITIIIAYLGFAIATGGIKGCMCLEGLTLRSGMLGGAVALFGALPLFVPCLAAWLYWRQGAVGKKLHRFVLYGTVAVAAVVMFDVVGTVTSSGPRSFAFLTLPSVPLSVGLALFLLAQPNVRSQ
ncbi:MAG: hypothetical protein AAF626_13460 [Pseudomonadota bacterium]